MEKDSAECVLGTNTIEFDLYEIRTVTFECEKEFTAKRLVIPSTIAASFAIVDLKIAGKSQMQLGDELSLMPAVMFTELTGTPAPPLKLSVCPVGKKIELTIKNQTSEKQKFHAAIIGRVPRFGLLDGRAGNN